MAFENAVVLIPLGIELVNLALLLVLMRIFWVNYRRLRSAFTRGLLLFVIAFFLKSLLTVGYFGFFLYNYGPSEHGSGILPFAFNVFESIALLLIIKVTRE
jgi:hypothetical protein